jgi:hypothetical protein
VNKCDGGSASRPIGAAAFEIAAPLQGRLEKVEATYVFLEGRPGAGADIALNLQAIIKIGYADDMLIVRRIDPGVDAIGTEVQRGVDSALYVVSQPGDAVSGKDVKSLARPNLASSFLSIYLHALLRDGQQRVVSLVYYAGGSEPPVTFSEDNRGISLNLGQRTRAWVEGVIAGA